MYKDVNDYELLYLIAEKDEIAYNDMYSKYSDIVRIESDKLYRKWKYLGISKEDLYQAGLYGLTQAIDNFDEKEGVLFYTCANTFINREIQTFIRDKSRQKHLHLSNSISLDKEIDEEGDTISNFVESNENTCNNFYSYINSKRIIDLKYGMPFLCSLVFELRINNFTNKEISILLDEKYKTIDNAVTKIRNIIKKEINKIELF